MNIQHKKLKQEPDDEQDEVNQQQDQQQSDTNSLDVQYQDNDSNQLNDSQTDEDQEEEEQEVENQNQQLEEKDDYNNDQEEIVEIEDYKDDDDNDDNNDEQEDDKDNDNRVDKEISDQSQNIKAASQQKKGILNQKQNKNFAQKPEQNQKSSKQKKKGYQQQLDEEENDTYEQEQKSQKQKKNSKDSRITQLQSSKVKYEQQEQHDEEIDYENQIHQQSSTKNNKKSNKKDLQQVQKSSEDKIQQKKKQPVDTKKQFKDQENTVKYRQGANYQKGSQKLGYKNLNTQLGNKKGQTGEDFSSIQQKKKKQKTNGNDAHQLQDENFDLLDDFEEDESCFQKYKFQIISSLIIIVMTATFYVFFFYFILDDEELNSSRNKENGKYKFSNDLVEDMCLDYLYKGKCVKQCPIGTLQHEMNCLDKCPDKYYISNGLCMQYCYQFISQDIYCSHNCTADEKYVINRKCYKECPKPYYGFQNQCLLDCPEGYFKSGKNCLEKCSNTHFSNLTCVDSCPQGYIENTENKLCEVNQQYLNGSVLLEGKLVSKCPITYFEQESQCVTQCQDGFYRNYAQSVCSKCKNNCLFCTNPDGQCTKCKSNFNLLNGKCVESCQQISIQYNTTNNENICKKGCQIQSIQEYIIFSEILQKSISIITVTSNLVFFFEKQVVYVFHDYNQTPSFFLQYNIQCLIQQLNIVLVLVPGDSNFYQNLGQNNQYINYFTDEVMQLIEEKTEIFAGQESASLVGIGMGVLGSLQAALYLPNKFGVLGIYNPRGLDHLLDFKDFESTLEYKAIFDPSLNRNASQFMIKDADQLQNLGHLKVIVGYDNQLSTDRTQEAKDICVKYFQNKTRQCHEIDLVPSNQTIQDDPVLNVEYKIQHMLQDVISTMNKIDF